MAAPSGIVWGSEVGSGSYQARIGIYVKLTSTATETTRHTEIWFWSKYSVSDSSNTFYYDDNASSATTSKGSVGIKTSVSSGSGWSTSNQVKISEYDYTFTRGTSASTRSVAAKLTGIDIIGSTMTATTTYTIPALASYTVSYNANGGTGAPGNDKKYYGKTLTLSSTKPTRTGYNFQGWATSANGSVVNQPGGTYTGNAAITYYAIWKKITYTITYKENGGSGQPSNQTKTYGEDLTLSGVIPNKTGYDFVSWNTKDNGTGTSYAPGAKYTANAAVTLYAIWKKKIYTVKYDENGGTNAPGDQTKTYDVSLTLSSVKPTKANYTFKGWATSKNGSVVYASGATYTANADVTLYAVWEDSYDKPSIKSFSVTRCKKISDNEYATSDAGNYALVKFSWTSSVASPSALIEWKASADTSWSSKPVSLTGTDGTVEEFIGGSLELEKSYSIKVTVDDGKDPQTTTRNLPGNAFPIDVKAGGTGVAIGKPAELNDHLDCGFNGRFRKNVMFGEKTGYHDGKTGVYINGEGYMHIQRSSAEGYHPYLGFYLDGSTSADGQVRVNCDTGFMEFLSANGYKFGNNLYFPNSVTILGEDQNKNGNFKNVFQAQNIGGHTVIGYGNYVAASGNTGVYGNDVEIGTAAAGNITFRPYYRKGDTINITWTGAGFISSSKTIVYFAIPLAKPVIGSPTISVASVKGLNLRQNDSYTHGSSETSYVKPASYSAGTSAGGSFVLISATMSNTTNAVNNSPIGIQFDGTITFT